MFFNISCDNISTIWKQLGPYNQRIRAINGRYISYNQTNINKKIKVHNRVQSKRSSMPVLNILILL